MPVKSILPPFSGRSERILIRTPGIGASVFVFKFNWRLTFFSMSYENPAGICSWLISVTGPLVPAGSWYSSISFTQAVCDRMMEPVRRERSKFLIRFIDYVVLRKVLSSLRLKSIDRWLNHIVILTEKIRNTCAKLNSNCRILTLLNFRQVNFPVLLFLLNAPMLMIVLLLHNGRIRQWQHSSSLWSSRE